MSAIVAEPRRFGRVGAMLRSRLLRRLLRQRMFVVGTGLLLAMVLLALLAPLIAAGPYDKMFPRSRLLPPGGAFLLGTDHVGRDLLSRVAYGGRLSLLIGLVVMVVSGVLGTTLGVLAGYVRSLDNPVMRVMDALMAFPAILLAIAISAALGGSALNAVIALSAVYTPRTARIVRATTLVVREMDYVKAAIVAGAGGGRIMLRHILPNSIAPLIVQTTFIFAYAVVAEAILSFLGVGAQPPTPSWGNIIAEGRNYIRDAPWITMFPGFAIAMTVLGLNLIGDGLRDALNPRLKVQLG
jgi:peptide/nickel transport system permease protein